MLSFQITRRNHSSWSCNNPQGHITQFNLFNWWNELWRWVQWNYSRIGAAVNATTAVIVIWIQRRRVGVAMYLRKHTILKLLAALALFFCIRLLCTSWKTSITESNTMRPKCRWPPINVNDIRTIQGSYNITLCIYSPSDTQNETKMYPFESLFRNPQLKKMVSFEDIGLLSRYIWRYARYPAVYRTYPQDVPFETILKAIK